MAEQYQPNETQIREAATLLIAIDSILWDEQSLENAVPWAKQIVDAIDTNLLWKDGKHCGDCTKEAHTCTRCFVEDAEQEIRKRIKDE